jgi:Cu-Zn family superoxide dismutase
MSAKLTLVAAVGLSIAIVGCNKNGHQDHHTTGGMPNAQPPKGSPMAMAKLSPSKNATTQPAFRNVAGEVTFTEIANGVHIAAAVTGLEPNKEFGFHIHEKGDLSAPDLTSAGGHFNPGGAHHGGPSLEGKSHAGDLGNLKSDAMGIAKKEIDVPNVTLNGSNNLVGRSVVVHAKADDLKSDPAGNSGPRVAAGVIEMAK